MLCCLVSIRCSGLDLLLQLVWEFLIFLVYFCTFYQSKCTFLFLLFYGFSPGGFVGDGHPVGSGQPIAGEIQDSGWNR